MGRKTQKEKPLTKRQEERERVRRDKWIEKLSAFDRLFAAPMKELSRTVLGQRGSHFRLAFDKGAVVLVYKGPSAGKLHQLIWAFGYAHEAEDHSVSGNVTPPPNSLDAPLKKLVEDHLAKSARKPGDWHEGLIRVRRKPRDGMDD